MEQLAEQVSDLQNRLFELEQMFEKELILKRLHSDMIDLGSVIQRCLTLGYIQEADFKNLLDDLTKSTLNLTAQIDPDFSIPDDSVEVKQNAKFFGAKPSKKDKVV